MSQIKVDTITDELGTGSPSFPNGVDAADLTGTLPALDASALTDLDASELTGALPAIDGSALTGVSPTTFAAVGTYSWVIDYGVGQDLGDTIAGSTIRPARIDRSANVETGTGTSLALGSAEDVLSGTWRIMSGKNDGNDSTRSYFFLALRIS